MYRCHFTCNGRVVAGGDLGASTLADAVQEAELDCGSRVRWLRSMASIWYGSQLLHVFIADVGVQ